MTSSKTNNQETKEEWYGLFDQGKEKKQDAITTPLNEEEFKQVMIEGMQQLGYGIKKVED